MEGLRERKRVRTRAHIAATAARLFAERGFEKTSIVEVARAAEVSEQTVYNHFPTKEDLVVDKDDEVRAAFVAAVRDRPPGVGAAAALREAALGLVDALHAIDADELRGTLGYLGAVSPAVHRLALESTDRLADALAAVLVETSDPSPPPAWAKVQGVALAWLSQTVIDESGRLAREGLGPVEIAERLRPVVADVVDRLDAAWP